VEPMLGFLGTIIGLIQAFMNWESLGEKITINVLAGGIYQAMITTAAGLSIAIPYYLIYNHLVTRVGRLSRLTEERAEEFVDLLTETTTIKEPARHAL
jgi:biopolymer transport protein ExbB